VCLVGHVSEKRRKFSSVLFWDRRQKDTAINIYTIARGNSFIRGETKRGISFQKKLIKFTVSFSLFVNMNIICLRI